MYIRVPCPTPPQLYTYLILSTTLSSVLWSRSNLDPALSPTHATGSGQKMFCIHIQIKSTYILQKSKIF